MTSRWSKILGLIVAAALLISLSLSEPPGSTGSLKAAAALILIVSLLWFAEPLEEYLGPARGSVVDRQSPGWMIATAAWFLLLVVPLIIWLLQRDLAQYQD